MIDDRANGNTDHAGPDPALDRQRRTLELQLIKIRNEASAARLEARAAEIELMIRELVDDPPHPTTGRCDPPHRSAATATTIASWDELRTIIAHRAGTTSPAADQSALPCRAAPGPAMAKLESSGVDAIVAANQADLLSPGDDAQSAVDRGDRQASPDSIVRVDGGAAAVGRPRFLDLDSDQPNPAAVESAASLTIDAQPDDEQEPRSPRWRPAAWLGSAIVHLAILLILAAIGIQSRRPRDQVALAGSVPDVSEVAMETFELTSREPLSEPSETAPSETEMDFSPVADVVASEFVSDAPPSPPAPVAPFPAAGSPAAAVSLQSSSDAKIEFCGVEGGGNHFVYLVDCSNSMKAGFQSARQELLDSIDALTAKQRFYVIFYDAAPDFMRLRDPRVDEPRSVYATPQNKAALRRWAMQISMDKGWAPYEPMKFALGLKPDVIFLLSDGEFPQRFEEMVRAENKIENLFGDSDPISIIHTISYHSKAGESRMQRIAQQNQGQYRHVPQP